MRAATSYFYYGYASWASRCPFLLWNFLHVSLPDSVLSWMLRLLSVPEFTYPEVHRYLLAGLPPAVVSSVSRIRATLDSGPGITGDVQDDVIWSSPEQPLFMYSPRGYYDHVSGILPLEEGGFRLLYTVRGSADPLPAGLRLRSLAGLLSCRDLGIPAKDAEFLGYGGSLSTVSLPDDLEACLTLLVKSVSRILEGKEPPEYHANPAYCKKCLLIDICKAGFKGEEVGFAI